MLESADRIAVIACERFPDDPDNFEVERGLTTAALQAKVDAFDDYLLDVAVLTLDRRARTIRYRASPVVSAPVYLIAERGRVAIDWDYSRLLGDRATDIVWPLALAQIAGVPNYGHETMVAGLYRATAGATLIACPHGVAVDLPDAVDFDGPHDVLPGADIESEFFDTVAALLAARPLDPARTAVELSGGMDSALAALAAASLAGPGLISVGAEFGGAMGEAQRARRQLLRAHGGFDDLAIPAERFAPFAPTSARRRRYGVWPQDENYPEMFEAIFTMLRTAGVDTLVSGYGGDELYTAYEGEDGVAAKGPVTANPFLTREGLAIANAAHSIYPRGWLQESCWLSAAGQSQRLLRHGLWPVYPYHNVPLARFVSRLPRAWRRDRRLLRASLTRALGNPVFETDYIKETFDPVARRGIAENRDYLRDLVRRSPLSAHPAIDDRAIVSALDSDVAALPQDTYNALFRVLKVFGFFQSGN